jgi:diguanylate cyclase (GGDEF)-like protein
VFFLDLDSFKTVNDTMGHEAGDELLIILANKISQSIRKYDVVGRFGGDEFLILLNNISSSDDILIAAQRVMDIFSAPISINSQEFFITASMGIAVYPQDGENVETMIQHADLAMYNAKAKGKNQFVLCSPILKEEVLRDTKLTNLLYRAMERNELMLYYQPQINLQTQKIVGMEALLRWNTSEYGMVQPNTFIPLAEKTGLINPIGEWVLRTACFQNKAWQDKGFPKIRMAVNLSAVQFRNGKLVSQIQNILSETRMHSKYLELEITESLMISQPEYIIDVLKDLKKLGASISIDDFGTGYSSLSRLKRLPFDRIKMDMQFVSGIEESEKDRAIAKVIINLAKNMGINVIAEGVETEKQLSFLSQKMCDEIQGFYYYKPMPPEEVEKIFVSLALQSDNQQEDTSRLSFTTLKA